MPCRALYRGSLVFNTRVFNLWAIPKQRYVLLTGRKSWLYVCFLAFIDTHIITQALALLCRRGEPWRPCTFVQVSWRGLERLVPSSFIALYLCQSRGSDKSIWNKEMSERFKIIIIVILLYLQYSVKKTYLLLRPRAIISWAVWSSFKSQIP